MSLTRRTFACGLCAAAALSFARTIAGQTPAATPETSFIDPGYQPAPDTDEKGLWAIMDRAERELKTSRFLIRDREVNDYVHRVACCLAERYCPDLRTYVVRTAHFNASMAPNGMMQVWTGLLLRCGDEAQLAAILGHELGHYLRRHTVDRWRDVRSKNDLATFLSLGLAIAGVGYLGAITQFALVASMFQFSRDQEREADEIGLDLMSDAGYVPIAAPEVWEQLLAEFKGSTAERDTSVLFATHPLPEERLQTLSQRASARGGDAGERGRDTYRTKMAGIRPMLLADELALRQYGRSEIVFEQLLANVPDDGQLWFAKGEVYRLRGSADDAQRALTAYERALQATGAPPEIHRSIMLVELTAGGRDRAREAFDTYSRLKPGAQDLEVLRALLP